MACSQNVWRFDGKLRSPPSLTDADIQFIDSLLVMGPHRRIKRAGVVKIFTEHLHSMAHPRHAWLS